mmetsp:Transcript_1962/g.4474  ORF Transcript_1962/g.4474 Transcript_1962/m.4474 type:complete len:307 (-) Transcript_1962:1576-2496(-)
MSTLGTSSSSAPISLADEHHREEPVRCPPVGLLTSKAEALSSVRALWAPTRLGYRELSTASSSLAKIAALPATSQARAAEAWSRAPRRGVPTQSGGDDGERGVTVRARGERGARRGVPVGVQSRSTNEEKSDSRRIGRPREASMSACKVRMVSCCSWGDCCGAPNTKASSSVYTPASPSAPQLPSPPPITNGDGPSRKLSHPICSKNSQSRSFVAACNRLAASRSRRESTRFQAASLMPPSWGSLSSGRGRAICWYLILAKSMGRDGAANGGVPMSSSNRTTPRDHQSRADAVASETELLTTSGAM